MMYMSINALPFQNKSYALSYAAQGFPVFPCKIDKKPYTTHGFKDATADINTIMAWWDQWPDASIGIPTAGYTVLDVDPKNGGDKTLAEWTEKHGALPVTPTARTGSGGLHYWFKGSARCSVNKKAGLDIRSDGGYVVVPPSLHPSGNRYEWINDLRTPMAEAPAWLIEALLVPAKKKVETFHHSDPFMFTWGDETHDLATDPGADEGERNATLCRLVGVHIDRGDSKASVMAMAKMWARRCRPTYPEAEAERTVNNLYTKAEAKGEYLPIISRNGHVDGDYSFVRPPDPPTDPAPLSEEDDGPTVPVLADDAFYGVLGEYVRLIEPHTEADPAAILVAGLVAFGNACGNGPNYVVEADRHHTNLFAVCVGESGHGRKGVSLNRALALFPEEFVKNNISQGLSSGEGLIFAVRDQTTKYNAKDEVLEIIDPGVSDKRLLVTETEYAQTLKVLKREGNTLSPILRVAFDGGVLRAMTKNQTKATDPHVSIVAHVTRQELKKCLGESEYFNGFANRFLWAITRRTKLISENGDCVDISPFQQRVANALSQAMTVTTMKRSEEARALWRDLYVKLNGDRSGMFGACTSRAAPITLRLSMIYALADGVDVIEVKHLQAAHAVWRYCEASARLIFGEEQADALTSEVHRLICARPGLTKTDLINALNRNVPAKDIAGALVTLYGKGKITCTVDKSGPGRPAERWYPAGQQVPPPSQPDPPLRRNELTNKVLANGQAQAGAGDNALIRLFVDPGQAQADGQAGAGVLAQAGPGAAEALARPVASKELPALLSHHAEAQHHAEGHAEAEADDDPEFLAILKRIEARPKAKLPLGTALLTPWGITATLTSVYEGIATAPVDIVNGVIVTPLAMLYRLVMDSQAKAQCPALAGRGIDLGNGLAILDLPIAEVEAWAKA
jgi:hypothetical protein